MKRIYIILFTAFLFIHLKSGAQGCVAIRSNGNTCTLAGTSWDAQMEI